MAHCPDPFVAGVNAGEVQDVSTPLDLSMVALSGDTGTDTDAQGLNQDVGHSIDRAVHNTMT